MHDQLPHAPCKGLATKQGKRERVVAAPKIITRTSPKDRKNKSAEPCGVSSSTTSINTSTTSESFSDNSSSKSSNELLLAHQCEIFLWDTVQGMSISMTIISTNDNDKWLELHPHC
jgi:hypothetical protein